MEELASRKNRIFLAQSSFALSIVLLVIKFWAYKITSSQSVLSDAMETVVNVVASALALWVIYWASKPADKDHPYGHGKAELLSAAFEGGLIFAAAILIVASSVETLIAQRPLEQLGVGLFITAGAAVINGGMGYLLKWRGKQLKSQALQASGDHLISDLITSIGVIFGLFLVIWTGQIWIDSVCAILVAIHLLYVGWGIIKNSLEGLLDTRNTEYLEEFRKIINEYRQKGIIQIHHVRMIMSGDYHHIDAHVVLPEYWDVKRAHDVTVSYEHEVFKRYGHDGELHFHIDPCQKRYCRYCEEPGCPIRQGPFQEYRKITLEEMLAIEEPKVPRD